MTVLILLISRAMASDNEARLIARKEEGDLESHGVPEAPSTTRGGGRAHTAKRTPKVGGRGGITVPASAVESGQADRENTLALLSSRGPRQQPGTPCPGEAKHTLLPRASLGLHGGGSEFGVKSISLWQGHFVTSRYSGPYRSPGTATDSNP